jgi:hypothetical protein
MKRSRKFLLGVAAVGLQVGLASAAEPPAPPAPASDATLPAATAAQPPRATDSCCDTEGEGSAAQRSGLIAGAGVYLFQPYFSNNMAFGLQGTENRSPGSPAESPGTRFDTRVDISHHVDVAPLVWLGYIGDGGLGFRARWWYFRQGTEQSATGTGSGVNGVQVLSAAPLGLSLITASGGEDSKSLVVTSKLQVQVLDLDSIYRLGACKWDLLFAGGLRLAGIDQAYNAYTAGEALLSSNKFYGLGPTLAVEVRRALGDTGFRLYGSARGSVLFGSGHQEASVPDRNVVARDHHDIGMPVAEAEFGLEYARDVGGWHFFVQTALVGQEWFGAGGASRSSTDVIPGGQFSTSSYVGDSDLAFLGACIRLGVNY